MRLHWGKHFPLGFTDICPLYPEMEKFRELCARNDPNGVFRNSYTARAGLGAKQRDCLAAMSESHLGSVPSAAMQLLRGPSGRDIVVAPAAI